LIWDSPDTSHQNCTPTEEEEADLLEQDLFPNWRLMMSRIKETKGRFCIDEQGAWLEIEHDEESNNLCIIGKNWVYLDRQQTGRPYDWLKKNLRRMTSYKKVREKGIKNG
jgi:hypothetical protein